MMKMKRARLIMSILTLVAICLILNMSAYAEDNPNVSVDKEAVKKGLFRIGYTTDKGKILKVIVEKGDKKFVYNLRNDGVQESYALQSGNGEYKASVYENIGGNQYMPIYTETMELNLEDDKILYLNSIQNIHWDSSMITIKKAIALVKKTKDSQKKLELIYKFVVPYLKYDYEKLKNINKLPNPYIPSVDKTFSERKGICYDYSVFFAAMLRSEGIPTKLMMGYSKFVKEYHAWNEVYMESTGKWVVIDTTYDSCMYAGKAKYAMIKDASAFNAIKNY